MMTAKDPQSGWNCDKPWKSTTQYLNKYNNNNKKIDYTKMYMHKRLILILTLEAKEFSLTLEDCLIVLI